MVIGETAVVGNRVSLMQVTWILSSCSWGMAQVVNSWGGFIVGSMF